MKKPIGRIPCMSSAIALARRLLKPVVIVLGILVAVCYLLSGITVTPPEKDETACHDDGYWAMIENERESTL